MTKDDLSFDDWFDNLTMLVADRGGAQFRDREAVRDDYERGRNLYDVVDEIAAEYGDDD